MKKRYLVCHDYGQGGLWAYIHAESPEDITAKFDLEVIPVSPPWLTIEVQAKLETYDVDRPDGWLAIVVKK